MDSSTIFTFLIDDHDVSILNFANFERNLSPVRSMNGAFSTDCLILFNDDGSPKRARINAARRQTTRISFGCDFRGMVHSIFDEKFGIRHREMMIVLFGDSSVNSVSLIEHERVQ